MNLTFFDDFGCFDRIFVGFLNGAERLFAEKKNIENLLNC